MLMKQDVGATDVQPRYHKLARQIAELIESGTLRPGDRVPSVRKLRVQANASAATVLHAYQILEHRGLIEAKPQSGYFVKSPAAPACKPIGVSAPSGKSQAVRVTHWLTRINRDMCDPALVPLGGAHPSKHLLPVRQLNRIQGVLARVSPRGLDWYESVAGAPELRSEVARLCVNSGCSLTPDDFVVTCGCQEALVLSLSAIAKRGDTIGVESPAYFGVLQALEALGMRAMELPTDPRTGIDVNAVTRAARRRVIKAVIVNPNHQNPLGFTMSDADKRSLLGVCQKHNLPLIEDDCYGDLHYGERRPTTIKSMDDSGLVMLCSGFSKTLAPGMRVGWCAPGRWREQVERLKFCTTICAPTLSQQVIARYLDVGGYERFVRRTARTYEQHTRMAAQAILRAFPEGTRVTTPTGGYVLWIEMPRRVDALKLYDQCVAEKICIAPGSIFSPSGRYRNFVRLSFAYPWSRDFERAIDTIGRHARSLCGGA